MRKLVGMLLALMLLIPVSPRAFAEVESDTGIWDATFSGYTFPIPEAYKTAAGFIHFFDFGNGLEFEGTGVSFSRVYYTGMTLAEHMAAVDEIDMAFLMEEWDLVGELEMELEKSQLDLFSVYVTANPWGTEELRAFLLKMALGSIGALEDETRADLYRRGNEVLRITEIGEKDGYRYYLVSNTLDIAREGAYGEIAESYWEEYAALLEQPELITDNFTMTTPEMTASIDYYAEADDDVYIEALF